MKTIEDYVGRDIFFGVLFALACAIALLSGCASKPTAPTAEDTIKAGLMDGAVAAAKAPLFKLSCPTAGCILGSLEVGNPSGAAQMADVVRVVMTPQETEFGRNYRATLGVVAQVGSGAVIGHYGEKIVGNIVGGFRAGFTSNENIAKFVPQSGPITNNNIGGNGVVGPGSITDRHDVTAPITNTDRHDITNPQIPCVVTPTFTATGAPAGFVRSGC